MNKTGYVYVSMQTVVDELGTPQHTAHEDGLDEAFPAEDAGEESAAAAASEAKDVTADAQPSDKAQDDGGAAGASSA